MSGIIRGDENTAVRQTRRPHYSWTGGNAQKKDVSGKTGEI